MPLPVLEQSSLSLDPATLPSVVVPALYVHIPFCFHKCHYCDFYSITHQSEERMSRFVDLVLREAEMWSTTELRPKTIFFGGGTPSLLPMEQMRRLIAGLRERIDFSQLDEFTVEANPATVSLEYFQVLRSIGVNRVSLGAQSFDRTELKLLERHHDPDDVPASLELARRAGFERINFDLIYAIPGQTLESWSQSLDRAIALGTTHLSCYGLTYEPNTPIAVKKRLGVFRQAPESLELEMLRHARSSLTECGLAPYEISNYAAPNEECRHNLVYWTGGSYIGLGPSAASHVEGWRWKNRPHLGEWERAIESHALPAIDVEQLAPLRRAGELAMLLLRLSRGLNCADFSARTTFDPRRLFADPIERFARVGLLQVDETAIRLTDAGLSVADSVAAEFLAATE